jgi:hypothetical protein
VRGYNAQAVVTEQQVVIAAELTQDANDVEQLAPMLQAVDQTRAAAEIPDRLGMLLADYWSIANLTSIPDAPELLVWPSKTGRTGKPRKDGKPSASRSDGLRAAMFATLGSEAGKARYALRKQTVELVSGSSRSGRAPAGSPAAGWPPARRSGSCCAAPTTCSSCGATPAAKPHPHQPPPEPTRPRSLSAPTGSRGPAAPTTIPAPGPSTTKSTGRGLGPHPFRNRLLRVNRWNARSAPSAVEAIRTPSWVPRFGRLQPAAQRSGCSGRSAGAAGY